MHHAWPLLAYHAWVPPGEADGQKRAQLTVCKNISGQNCIQRDMTGWTWSKTAGNPMSLTQAWSWQFGQYGPTMSIHITIKASQAQNSWQLIAHIYLYQHQIQWRKTKHSKLRARYMLANGGAAWASAFVLNCNCPGSTASRHHAAEGSAFHKLVLGTANARLKKKLFEVLFAYQHNLKAWLIKTWSL